MTRTVAGEVVDAIDGRIARGEPEPGDNRCSRCGGPAVVFADRVGPDEIQTATFICPCCSFKGCPHADSWVAFT